jgi:hypothetical protein
MRRSERELWKMADCEDDPIRTAEAIRECLRYLYGESHRLGLLLTANLIGAAHESILISDDVNQKECKH